MENQSRLTLVGITDLRLADRHILYYYDCSCGGYVLTPKKNVDSGNTKSCGCLHKENSARLVKKVQHKAAEAAKTSNRTHGMRNTRFYRIWQGMRSRCKDTTNPNYGGRGISVCDRWETFEHFRDDMHESFVEHAKKHGNNRKGTSIDRIDVDGNYEPRNVRWATSREQAANKRPKEHQRNSKGQFIN